LAGLGSIASRDFCRCWFTGTSLCVLLCGGCTGLEGLTDSRRRWLSTAKFSTMLSELAMFNTWCLTWQRLLTSSETDTRAER